MNRFTRVMAIVFSALIVLLFRGVEVNVSAVAVIVSLGTVVTILSVVVGWRLFLAALRHHSTG